MEFMSRGNRPGQPAPLVNDNNPANNQPGLGSVDRSKATTGNDGKRTDSKMFRVVSVVFLFAVTILILAAVSSLAFGKPNGVSANEFKNVDTSKLQAVFLNGGQVYFGKINSLNPQFMRVSDIYYLRVNQQVQPDQQAQQANNDISLVKLGCELHGPEDSMVINREQVIFWENLKTDGQVAKAVEEFQKQNPEGQKCEQPQGGGTTTPTTPTTPTPPTTPTTPTTPQQP